MAILLKGLWQITGGALVLAVLLVTYGLLTGAGVPSSFPWRPMLPLDLYVWDLKSFSGPHASYLSIAYRLLSAVITMAATAVCFLPLSLLIVAIKRLSLMMLVSALLASLLAFWSKSGMPFTDVYCGCLAPPPNPILEWFKDATDLVMLPTSLCMAAWMLSPKRLWIRD